MGEREDCGLSLYRLCVGAHAIGPVAITPLALLALGNPGLDLGGALLAVGDEALEPCVLRLELLDAGLEHADALRHLLGRLLEGLLALLLLHAEAGARGCVAAALVLLGSVAGRLICRGLVGGACSVGLALLTGGDIEARDDGRHGRRGGRGVGVAHRVGAGGGQRVLDGGVDGEGLGGEVGEVGKLEVACEQVKVSHRVRTEKGRVQGVVAGGRLQQTTAALRDLGGAMRSWQAGRPQQGVDA